MNEDTYHEEPSMGSTYYMAHETRSNETSWGFYQLRRCTRISVGMTELVRGVLSKDLHSLLQRSPMTGLLNKDECVKRQGEVDRGIRVDVAPGPSSESGNSS